MRMRCSAVEAADGASWLDSPKVVFSLFLLAILVGEAVQSATREGENSPANRESLGALQREPISYDVDTAQWLFDPEKIVSRNDVLYTGPATTDWHAMPVGGGDLWARARCDGNLHLTLEKSDYWNGSLAEVEIDFGPRGMELAAKRFRQRLELYGGKIVVHLADERTGPSLEVWGHPTRRIIVIEVSDPQLMLGPPTIRLSRVHGSMTVGRTEATLWAKEVHTAAADVANTGMQGYFDEGNDPMLGRGLGVGLGTRPVSPVSCTSNESTATMVLPENLPRHYYLVVSAVVTEKTDPLPAAESLLADSRATPIETLKAEQVEWWRAYWGRSFLCFESFDQQAEWLTAAYHIHLYTLGCVNRGTYPHNYDGGSPLADWVQEVRWIFNPLYAANRLEMARLLPDTFSSRIAYLERQTNEVWGVEGIWVPECYLPWGHTNDVVLKDDGRDLSWLWFRRDPAKVPYGRFELYNNHTGLIFTSGLEISHHYLTYYRYSNDEEFLRDQAYPFIRGVCEFISNIVKKEEDGRYHLDPANALETWWSIRDPADALDGILAIFPEFIRLSEDYGLDGELRTRCRAVLAGLPEPSIGKWYDDGRVDPTIDAYAPAGGKHEIKNRINAENPALYRVYPFGLSGIGSPDYQRAKRTFEYRTSPLWFGWAMDAIWAARLGLADEACPLLVEHARRFNVFPYGGWHFSAHACHDKPFPHNRTLYTVPFLDAGGCSATAFNEILLQSHNGLIRIAPAVDKRWSGIFRLRAEGGFLVAADVYKGHPRFAEIRSVSGKRCRVARPWPGKCVIRTGQETLLETADDPIEFDTDAGAVYVVEPADRPVSGYPVAPVETWEAFQRTRGYAHYGVPGRD